MDKSFFTFDDCSDDGFVRTRKVITQYNTYTKKPISKGDHECSMRYTNRPAYQNWLKGKKRRDNDNELE